MKVLYGVLQDFNPVTLHDEGKFTWVSFIYPLFDDIVFVVDLFPDTSFTCSITTEAMI